MDNWTADSSKALNLSLVRASLDNEVLTSDESYEEFHPTFTYPIYGDDEKIYGYRDLVIDLRFASGSLVPYLNTNFSAKLQSTSTVDDVEGTLQQIPCIAYYLKDEEEFLARVEKDSMEFKPLGEKIFSYKRSPSSSKGKKKAFDFGEDLDETSDDVVVFEAYHVRSPATWDTLGFREYHRRMQIFILLYIEAGSFIKEDEEGWEFVVLYEKRRRRDGTHTYHFVGYSSLFPFFCFPDRVRMRLSQFVIVPPFQHAGHGSALYTAIYQYVLGQSRIAELTVEDPAEAFEDLRDRNDLHMLLGLEPFITEALGGPRESGLVRGKARLGPPVEKGWAEKWRQDLKIAGRQFHRLIEMLILKHIDLSDSKAVRAYRLQVKERLYKFNYEILAQLENKSDRLEKLEETFQSVREDYRRILAMI
ncbi:histone acetyltransferase type B catalytic subunit [Fomitiporia mediterranea MF3/22]|uniref:histone acetyltransferase type B catalytic subunit n=1 Tax=Fomitiporia mediterranea (strain MF3/22) TaxID=694068 RepID=UPI000440749A|nr:histone acetyltransferase type B catalytic subunit [Fomitiporia mediterranea MF3/22]EJD06193.1 histone acetyltransferase type B catalytic subunit [Fomitiporia mediterranea MF3/22]